jgi:hypothetical protein
MCFAKFRISRNCGNPLSDPCNFAPTGRIWRGGEIESFEIYRLWGRLRENRHCREEAMRLNLYIILGKRRSVEGGAWLMVVDYTRDGCVVLRTRMWRVGDGPSWKIRTRRGWLVFRSVWEDFSFLN